MFMTSLSINRTTIERPAIDKFTSEDTMVATLLGLKAAHLAGQIEGQRFRVESMHIFWCAGQAGITDAVMRRVMGPA